MMWHNSRRVSGTVDAAGYRHERFGVAPHAVLADVEPVHLFASRDAQADGLLDDPEERVAEDEHRHERSRNGNRLRAELVEAAGVEEAALTDAVELGLSL